MGKGGRPSEYTQDRADKICERIVMGESLRAICKDDDMPSVATIFNWFRSFPEFLEQYTRAKEEQAETLADEIVAIADEECTMVRADKHSSRDDDGEGNTEVVFDSTAVARNRLRVEARKWVAAKLKPKRYGDKLELAGNAESPLTVVVRKLSDA